MEKDEVEQMIAEAEQTLERIDKKNDKMEYDASRDVLKHFDRIHDKLFMFNTVFITGYFALCQINKEFNSFVLISPFIAISILVYIEHSMKEIARRQTTGLKVNLAEYLKITESKYIRITQISFVVILLSAIELLYTMYVCIFKFA